MMRSHDLLDRLAASPSDQARLLAELLQALEWSGEDIQLRNALSGNPEAMSGSDLLNSLAKLGYRWDVHRLGLGARSRSQGLRYPLLQRVEAPGSPFTLARHEGELASGAQVLAYCFRFEPQRLGEQRQWFQALVLRYRRTLGELLLLSLLINLLALVLPFYMRAVYNLEIPGGQVSNLLLLLPLALGAVALQLWLTQRRQVRLAGYGAELELALATRVLEKVLRLRLPQLERYTALALSTRLQSYQGLRSYITGPLALAVLDLPFVVIYLVAIASMSLPLMGLTLLMAVVCFGGIWLVGSVGRALRTPLSRNPSGLEPMLLDLLQSLPQIKASGSERLWQARLEAASADQAEQGIADARLQQLLQILTGEFSQLTGALVLAVGTALALAGDGIELGTLIAAMFFVWRVFRPFQMAFQALSRWPQIRPTLEQLNRFMADPDAEPDSALSQHWVLSDPRGAIVCKAVSLRLNALQEPALTQLNLEIKPGELVALTGSEGSGCSALLRLLDAQVMPGSGVISLDGADLRQYPLAQLRQAVSYLSELPGILPGSLRENLLLANPLFSDAELEQGLRELALTDLLEGPGLNRPIRLQGPLALIAHQWQGVALCRALLKPASIVLLDQPFNRLTAESATALLQLLQQRRGRQTIVVAADQPELLQIADRIVVLKDGTVAFSGTPAELLAAQQR